MKTAVTHSGSFHADDVFAYAALRKAFADLRLQRTRDPQAIASAEIVFDVGAEYDAERLRYDHHQAGRPERDDGTPYSAFGLVWKHHGLEVVAALEPNLDRDEVAEVAAAVDAGLVLSIDKVDNGLASPDPGHVASFVDAMSPSWRTEPVRDFDRAFELAASAADAWLAAEVRKAADAVCAKGYVARAGRAGDRRILVLEHSLPWERQVVERMPDVLFVVSPDPSGGWTCRGVPVEPGSFVLRKDLPEEWAGLRGADLAAVTGLADATFCHLGRFICGAASFASALAMAEAAAAFAPSPCP